MKSLLILPVITLCLFSCNSGDTATEAPTPTADTVSQAPPVKTYPPEAGCNFAMRQIKNAPVGGQMAVTGTKRCDDGRVFQEVSLYAKGESINNKKANVYSIPDTINPVSISWQSDTLLITHNATQMAPTLQEFEVEGVPVVYAVEATK